MRRPCTIALAAAIVLASTDVSAVMKVNPVQANDVPIKRLLRSETSVDVEREERGVPSSTLRLSATDALPPDTLTTKMNDQDLKLFLENDFDELKQKLVEHNKDNKNKVTLMSRLRKIYDDEIIMQVVDDPSRTELRTALFNEWILIEKDFDSVMELEQGKQYRINFAEEYKNHVNGIIDGLKKSLPSLIGETEEDKLNRLQALITHVLEG